VGLARYLIGVTLAALALVPVFGGCVALRRRVLTRWSGPPARLAEVVLVLGLLTGVSEILGTFGLFRLGPMVAALVVTGATVWFLAHRVRMNRRADAVEVSPPGSLPTAKLTASDPMGDSGGDPAIPLGPSSAAGVSVVAPVTAVIEDESEAAVESNGLSDIARVPPNRLGRGALVVALVATAVLSAEWGARTVAALHHGMDTVDTLWYHLPTAARFVQDGSITGLHYVDPGPVVVFFPAGSALLHGAGILFLGSDLLSPLLNLGFLALTLLAAWCIGRPFGVAPVTLTGAAVLLATPGFVATQPGGGYNDVVGLALVLASVALLVNADREGNPFGIAEVSVAALAAGLALGTKFTFIAPVAALSVGVVVLAPRGKRLRRGGVWLFVVVLAGGFWYARNLAAIGNPLPDFSFGPLSLPSPPNPIPTSTVSQFLLDGNAWERYFLPGLGKAYGPAWWALVVLVAAGLVLAVLTARSRLQRMLGIVGIAAAVAYLFSPQFLTLLDVPYYFVYNLRYASPALLLGLVLLPTVPAVATGRRAWWALGAFAFVLVAIQLDPTVWPTEFFGLRFAEPNRGGDSLIGVLIGGVVVVIGAVILAAREHVVAWRTPIAAWTAVGVLVVVVGGFGLQRAYLRNRYVDTEPLPGTYHLARDLHDERIGVVGGLTTLQYPLYGKDLSNYVQYIGKRGPHGAFGAINDCADWRRAVNAGRYSYVVTMSLGRRNGPSIEAEWTRGDPAATSVKTKDPPNVSLFRIEGHLDPRACRQLPPGQRTKRHGRQDAGAGG
jgi:hypothetical protein